MREKVLDFIDSNKFIYFSMGLAVLNWALETIYIYIPVAIIFVYIIILLDLDRMKLISLLMAGLICFQLEQIEAHVITFGIMMFLIIPIFIYDLIKSKKYKFNCIFFGLLMWVLATVSSTLRTTLLIHSLTGILQMLLFLSIFFYFSSVLTLNDQNYKKTLVTNFIALAFAIILETLISLFLMGNFKNFINNDFTLGWGSFSTISTVFLIVLFVIIGEFSQKTNSIILPIIINIFIIFFLFFMTRGVYIVFLVLIIPFILHISKDFENKNKLIRFTTITLMTVLCVILLVGIPLDIVGSVIERLSDKTVNFEKLDIAFYKGLEVFKYNPIYGNGVFTSHYFIDDITSELGISFFYSNSIVRILSSLGLVGVGCFIYFLFTVFKSAKESTIYNKIVMYILIAFIILGFFEAVFLNVVTMILLILLLVGIEQKDEKVYIEQKLTKEEEELCMK